MRKNVGIAHRYAEAILSYTYLRYIQPKKEGGFLLFTFFTIYFS